MPTEIPVRPSRGLIGHIALTIESILNRKGRRVETIDLTNTIKLAADRMQYHGIAALIVMGGGRPVGILSEGDIVHAISRYGDAALQITVSHIVGPKLISVTPQDSVKRAMNLMTNNRIRHLPVLENGHLAGIVSLGDVVKHRLDELELETNVLRDVYIAAR